MPARSPSARRYAEAIFSLASEQGSLVQWTSDLGAIAGFVSEADVSRVLNSSRVPAAEKLRLLSAGLEREVGPHAWNLVRLLHHRGKIAIAPEIRDAFQEMVDESRGVAHAVVTTAVPLSDDERRAVAAKLSSITGKQVDVTPAVDESIIGGVVARIGDQLIDGSTRSRLMALKRRLEGAAR
ncbi:MAG TPA: F0F1 ATP synthase subunit delta [Dehalococcoidia bacterium]|nr:F0F1 ATP synthase subunit delta [Dehalococcoidia bacterium]